MSIQTYSGATNVISQLEDKPALTSAELKAKFDEGLNNFVKWFNKNVVTAINDGGVEIVNDLTTGGTTKGLSAEMGKELNKTKQNTIKYGTEVPALQEGEIFIQIFDE